MAKQKTFEVSYSRYSYSFPQGWMGEKEVMTESQITALKKMSSDKICNVIVLKEVNPSEN